MARPKQDPKPVERTRLLVPLAKARERVQIQLERGEAIPNQSINENEAARRWYEFTSELLRQISSTDELRDDFVGRSSFNMDISTGRYLKELRSIHDRLELLPAPADDDLGTSNGPRSKAVAKPRSRRVFVVHGHDDGLKETVARFLSKLDLQPVILHEQPNRGRTVVEKFEEHSDVAFAVVLFTPDDVGHCVGKADEIKPRARQNVVLELGFFMSALGRERVCILYKRGVEVPSDYAGVLYEELDVKGAWRFRLAVEIQAAGVEVDLNKAV
jgi:predicted nucleotide-binding protein